MENPKNNLKTQHRKALSEIRNALPIVRRKEGSVNACRHLLTACNGKGLILSFASFGSEIDLWPLNLQLAEQERLALPLTGKNKTLRLFQVTHLNQLKPHRFGMLEPNENECQEIKSSEIAIALIPGLGFDLKTRYRLGYGYGYYDQLLATASFSSWGIGFFEQVASSLPYTERDVPLNQIFLF